MKGWGLPFAGDPLNHSALLTQEQIDACAATCACPPTTIGRASHPNRPRPSSATQWPLDSIRTARGRRWMPRRCAPSDVPDSLPSRVPASISTQEVFGNALVELARLGGPLAERIVTASPDVTISTNLGGWVNRTGVWAENPWQAPATAVPRLLRWEPGPGGQHIELGISEMNLFMLLGQLGLSHELNGELLLPVGTVYDPFVCRGLDALIYSAYSGARFVFAGTPPASRSVPKAARTRARSPPRSAWSSESASVRAVLRARDRVGSARRAAPVPGPRGRREHVLATEHARGGPGVVRRGAGADG